jgi:hypothetical protein
VSPLLPSRLVRGVVLVAGVALAPALCRAAATPALVVVITIDQVRGDYPARFYPHFEPGGFRLFLEQGAVFANAHHRQSVTKTASGHATMLTGVHPNVNGIIANDWVDRTTLKKVNSVDDLSVKLVGAMPPRAGGRMPNVKVPVPSSPRDLLATTVIDDFKLARGNQPKVISISSKDRSAILLGGKLANAAYWMDEGTMITSTYYLPELPAWAKAFNDKGRVDSYFGKIWDRLLPIADYERLQGADDVEGESPEFGLGRTFPKKVDGGAATITPAYYEAFENSPFKNDVLLEFARTAVENENLGKRGVTDVLCLSFSTNDSIGHNHGPDSHEVMDITLRTDRMLAEFFKFLEARVGLKNCTLVLTGDHGTAPLPERLQALNKSISAGRVDNAKILKTCESALERAYGPAGEGRRWIVTDPNWILFVPEVLAEKKVAQADAEKIVADALRTIEFVELSYTRTQLIAGDVSGDYAEAALFSFNRERSGDVFYQLKPFWVDRKNGTNHGTPYNYDTHVPLLWYGVGVKPGIYRERVGIDDMAPTLAHLLGIPAPPKSRGRVLF